MQKFIEILPRLADNDREFGYFHGRANTQSTSAEAVSGDYGPGGPYQRVGQEPTFDDAS